MSGIIEQAMQAEARKRGAGKFVGYSGNLGELRSQLRAITDSKEGRKLTREAAKAALVKFNIETGKNAAALNLKPSGKAWRKKLQQLTSYRYKGQARRGGYFGAQTGINYAKAKAKVLKISHLVEQGFQHFRAGKISGNWFRKDAFHDAYGEVEERFATYVEWGWQQLVNTGKAPTAKQMRKAHGDK